MCPGEGMLVSASPEMVISNSESALSPKTSIQAQRGVPVKQEVGTEKGQRTSEGASENQGYCGFGTRLKRLCIHSHLQAGDQQSPTGPLPEVPCPANAQACWLGLTEQPELSAPECNPWLKRLCPGASTWQRSRQG